MMLFANSELTTFILALLLHFLAEAREGLGWDQIFVRLVL